jgi:hypothetical protein
MINLPETTNVYRRMPKELFYKYLNDNSTLKKTFIDEIKSVIWINTISSETTTTPKGKYVNEIAIVEIELNRQAINANILEIINREVDQYALFIVRYEEWGQIWCCDRQSLNRQISQFNCQDYYHTNWMNEPDLILKIDGENLDRIYENFFLQIAGKPVPVKVERNWENTNANTEKVEQFSKIEQLERLEAIINSLERQMKKEMQFDKQVRLATDLKKTQEEIKKIKSSMLTHIEIHQPEIVATQEDTVETVRPFFPNVYMKMQDRTGNRFVYSFL